MPPLRVLALGDSIMWGQGHTDATKFVTLVYAWLASRGHDPSLTSLAHSGAVVSPTQNDAAPAPWGEVPEPAPSIVAELGVAPQQVDPQAVDVVLLDGGINDVSVFHIVVADPFDPNGLDKLASRCNQTFSGPVRQLIDKTVSTFPVARIVVTGYYPIVSEQSGVRSLVQLMKQLPQARTVASFLDLTAEHLGDEALKLAIEPERRRMIEQSTLFGSLSTQLLRSAVGAYAATNRVFFADPGFGPQNAFAAPASWLWDGANDPLFRERVAKYAEHVITRPFDWPVYTPVASIGHPNIDGAKAYASAIEACLAQSGL
jgi:lysophospholipase L1-like esterase